MFHTDTIVALATAGGAAAIAVVRLSGPEAVPMVEKIFYPVRSSKRLRDQPTHTIHLGHLSDGEKILDQVLVSLFRAPNSYTGEDVVEIFCHGSLYIQQQLLQWLISKGVRLARSGEFTLRAFLNSKLDLSQAEAVADLIASESEAAHQVAMKQLRGGISDRIKKLRKELLDFASLIELELDFTEEDVAFADRSDLYQLLDRLEEDLRCLIDSFALGNGVKQGIPVVIVGAPNVGKSTLLNVLLSEERAIVSEIAGTTRDAIEGKIVLDGIQFRFVDTAGIRSTEDQIESIGIQKTFEKMEQAQVILYLFDSAAFDERKIRAELVGLQAQYPNKKLFAIANKSDFSPVHFQGDPPENFLTISAKQAGGIENLKKALVALINREALQGQAVILTQGRHYEALQKALEAVLCVRQGLDQNLSGDLVAVEIRQALRHLGEITGEVTADDLLGNIFSRFCIGK
ncbi:MAG: tRNA uridine-5-carboxymethylaminomethyl(34) synthesis GTPase MnmE [Flavobacteriales bacterium AspAUS03]